MAGYSSYEFNRFEQCGNLSYRAEIPETGRTSELLVISRQVWSVFVSDLTSTVPSSILGCLPCRLDKVGALDIFSYSVRSTLCLSLSALGPARPSCMDYMSAWKRKWWPIPVFCLENPMDRGAWQTTLHRVAKRWTWLSTHAPHITDCHFFFLLASMIYSGNIKHNKIAYLINMLLFFCKCIYCLVFSLILGNFAEKLEEDL